MPLDQMKTAACSTLMLLIAAWLVSGCASIVSGTQQSVSVTAKTPESVDVPGASCSFENGKGKWFASAPGSVTVHRAYSALIVHCDHPDWTGDTEAKSTTKGMAFGNILFGGVIGAGIDAGTGAAYDYPQLITVPMKARAAAPAAAAGGALASPTTQMATSVPPPTVTTAVPVAVVATQPVAAAPASSVARSADGVAMSTATVTAVAIATPQPAVAKTVPTAQREVTRPLQAGQDGFSASRLARNMACHPQPNAVMTAKGPGFEGYSVACLDGDALAIRCEFGNCRVLR